MLPSPTHPPHPLTDTLTIYTTGWHVLWQSTSCLCHSWIHSLPSQFLLHSCQPNHQRGGWGREDSSMVAGICTLWLHSTHCLLHTGHWHTASVCSSALLSTPHSSQTGTHTHTGAHASGKLPFTALEQVIVFFFVCEHTPKSAILLHNCYIRNSITWM